MERHKTNWFELGIESSIYLFAIGTLLGANALHYLTAFDYTSLPPEQFTTMPLIDSLKVIGYALIVLLALLIIITVFCASVCLFVYTAPHWLMGTRKIGQQLTETAVEHVTHTPLSKFVDDRFILIMDAAATQFGRVVSERCIWLRLWMWRLTALFHDRSRQTTFLHLTPPSNQQLIPLI